MSRLILLLSFLFFCGDVSAQTKKVLIVAPEGESKVQRMKSLIESHYEGTTVVLPSLPPVLAFDAIFSHHGGWSDEPVYDSAAQLRLINYLKNGGRFYAEGDSFRARKEGAFNGFWDFIGDSSEMYTAMVIDLTRIRGVDSEFTAGIDYPDEQYENMFNGDAGGGFHIREMRPLLWGDAAYTLPLAWAPFDRSIKAVLNWPIGNPQYDEFLARVICTYFQLCVLDVAAEEAKPTLSFDPIKNLIRLPAPGQVVLTDILGRIALTQLAESDRFAIPARITPGTYIATWTSGERRAAITITIR